MPTITAADLVTLRSQDPLQASIEWYMAVAPYGDPVFEARVDDGEAAITDPNMDIPYDNGTGSIEAGMTLWVGSYDPTLPGHPTPEERYNVGVVRVRADSTPDGGGEGTLDVAENYDIPWNMPSADGDGLRLTAPGEDGFREIWSKYQLLEDDGTVKKDYDIAYGSAGDSNDPGENVPPKANVGPPVAAWLDDTSPTPYVLVDFIAEDSYCVGAGEEISAYVWDFGDGVIDSWGAADPDSGAVHMGSAADPNVVKFEQAGFRYVKLTITSNDGGDLEDGIVYVPVWTFQANDEDTAGNALTTVMPLKNIDIVSQEGSIDSGWTTTVSVRDTDQSTVYDIPPWALVVLFTKTTYDGVETSVGGYHDRENIRMVGWAQEESFTFDHATGAVEFQIVSHEQRLAQLFGLGFTVQETAAPSEWHEMHNVDVDRAIQWYNTWHTTVNEVCHVECAGEGTGRAFHRWKCAETNLYGQIQDELAIDAQYQVRSDRQGILRVTQDPQFISYALGYDAGTTEFTEDAELTGAASGDTGIIVNWTLDSGSWGGGDAAGTVYLREATGAFTDGEALTGSQGGSATADGTATGRGDVICTLGSSDWRNNLVTRRPSKQTGYTKIGGFVPGGDDADYARLAWAPGSAPVQAAEELDQEGMIIQDQEELNRWAGMLLAKRNNPYPEIPIELKGYWPVFDHAHQEFIGLTVEDPHSRLDWTDERFIVRQVAYHDIMDQATAITEIVCEKETAGPAGVTKEIETLPEPDLPDIPDWTPPEPPPPPVPDDWTGEAAAYVLWAGTQLGRTWDITAAAPSWEDIKGSLTGNIRDMRYVHVDAETIGSWALTSTGVWWCGDIMASSPSWSQKLSSTDVSNAGDPNSIIASIWDCNTQPGYLAVQTGQHADNELWHWHTVDYGASWTAFKIRDSDNTAYSGRIVCVDVYGGRIWRITCDGSGDERMVYANTITPAGAGSYATHSSGVDHTYWNHSQAFTAPFPEITSPMYLLQLSNYIGSPVRLAKSTDGGLTFSTASEPNGDIAYRSKGVNSWTFEANHVIAWAKNNNLYESEDGAASWNLLCGRPVGHDFSTPGGWPGDYDTWFIVRLDSIAAPNVVSNIIYMTTDHFTSLDDKSGDWETVFDSYDGDSYSDGFPLPRVGANAA